jgi:restriction system protein
MMSWAAWARLLGALLFMGMCAGAGVGLGSALRWGLRRRRAERARRAVPSWQLEREQRAAAYAAQRDVFARQFAALEAPGRAARARQRAQQWDAQRRIANLHRRSDLLRLSDTGFEERVADLLVVLGLQEVEVVGGAGDRAVDIRCRTPAGEVMLVQCKRYTYNQRDTQYRPVTDPEMQHFVGMLYAHHRAARGAYFTTSVFTEPALELAEQHHIYTVDGDALLELLKLAQRPLPLPDQDPDTP